MTIIQQPHSISLSGNMQPFIINSGALVNFTLKDGAAILIESTYEPDSTGKITIDIKDIIESRLKYNIKGDSFYEQTEIVKQFTAIIDTQTINFKVVRAGVLNLADTPTNWLTGNFLTWQSQNKAVTYYSPEWLTYYATQTCTIKLKAYFPGKAEQIITLGSGQAGKAFSFNLQYAHVAGLLGSTYPTHYDVWAEATAGSRLSFIQRYYFSEVTSEQEQWVLFENSLGGLDTLRASGNTDLESDNEHKMAIVNGEIQEYKIDTKRIYSKNTGALKSYERQWLQDFPTAHAKYMHHLGALRKIAVVETPFNFAVSDSPTDFTFKYRFSNQSSLLNLTRSEHLIPSSITVPDIDAPGFFLPPRLSELPRVELGEDILIPAFSPHSNIPTVTTVGKIFETIIASVLGKIPGAGSGGQLMNILLEKDILPPSDGNVFSSLRSLKEIGKAITNAVGDLDLSDKYLSKVKADIAQKLIKFLEGIEIGNYTQGLLGGGGAFKMKDGISELEVDKLTVRMVATFFEIVVSKLRHINGGLVLSRGAMKCIKVIEDADSYQCFFDRGEDNEVSNSFVVLDQARCQVFNACGGKFYWRLVTAVGDDWIKLSKTNGIGDSIPSAGDDIVQLGYQGTNLEHKDRIYAQIIDSAGLKQYGAINSFTLEGKERTKISADGSDNKFYGKVTFTSSSGDKDLEGWTNEVENKIKEIAQKRSLRIEKWHTPGYEVYRDTQASYNHTLALKIYHDTEDVTDTINIAQFKWMRISDNTLGDPTWNELHANAGSSIDVTLDDLAGDTSFVIQFYDVDTQRTLTERF